MLNKIKELINHILVRDDLDDFKKKDNLILISCFFYMLPALYILYTPLKRYHFLAFVAFLQIILSVLSDYTFLEIKSKDKLSRIVGIIDRLNSIIYTFYILYFVFMSSKIPSLLYVSLAVFLIEYSRDSKNQVEWVSRHTLWHLASSLILLLCLRQINNVSNL